jgi:hypothetical protein
VQVTTTVTGCILPKYQKESGLVSIMEGRCDDDKRYRGRRGRNKMHGLVVEAVIG